MGGDSMFESDEAEAEFDAMLVVYHDWLAGERPDEVEPSNLTDERHHRFGDADDAGAFGGSYDDGYNL
jgi:hypothetical protein